jgi:hypothetical protein
MSGFYAKKAISITNDNDEVPLLWDDTWSEEHKLQKLQELQKLQNIYQQKSNYRN